MCFSAAASFTVAAVLFPIGTFSIKLAREMDKKWMALAICPMAFSIQQAIEGFLWFGVNSGDETVIALASRGFLFFSHLFWLAWIPFTVYILEDETWRKKILLVITGIGTLSGLLVFLPILFISDWLSVELVGRSLVYDAVLVLDSIASRTLLRALYTLVILSALFLSSDWMIRIFGGFIAVALIVTYVWFAHAIISVWCFFAAVLSPYILMMILIKHRRHREPS